mmetsp:Transcript_36783/g.84711  ORF Transcript_36783/g.84711 Transcript_36783/m.84711 type:complete len:94 (+) Transcript_36783:802-1083(+)|eukprot:5840834-Amphidinium_carterae.1
MKRVGCLALNLAKELPKCTSCVLSNGAGSSAPGADDGGVLGMEGGVGTCLEEVAPPSVGSTVRVAGAGLRNMRGALRLVARIMFMASMEKSSK